MTPEQINVLSESLWPEMQNYPEARRVVNEEDDTYKPFYRSLAILLGVGSLPVSLFQVKQPPTMDECEEILRRAHPYFSAAIERNRLCFEHCYNLFVDMWDMND